MAINSLSASSNGLSGLASGMDTESMVEQMLMGTQNKIDTTNQKITQLEYKQELYHSVISDLKTFQNTYFSFTNQETNLLSQSFFSTKAASSTSSAYSVTANTSANVGNVTIDRITSLATNYKQTAKNTASAKIIGNFDQALADAWKTLMTDEEKLTIKVGDKSVDIAAADIVGKGSLEVESVINTALKDNGVAAEMKFMNGKFTLKAEDDKAAITVSGTDEVKTMLGVTKDISATGKTEMNLDSNAALPSITIEVDGVSKKMTIDLFSDEPLENQLNKAISDAFGSGIEVARVGNSFGFAVTNASRKLTISGDEKSLKMLGLKNHASNKLSLTSALTDTQFETAVVGSQQRFSINGVDFSFSSDSSLTSIMTEINNSDAGVKISYSSTTDKFIIESKTTGSRTEGFEITQSEGNLMTAMFGVPAASNLTGNELTKQLTSATLPAGDFSFEGGEVTLKINDKNTTLTIEGKYTDAEKFVNAMNDALKTQFGEDSEGNANVRFEIADGTVSLKTNEDYTAHIENDSLKALGFDTAVNENTKLSELGIEEDVIFNIKDQEIKISADTTLADMVARINTAAGEEIASLKGNPPYIRLFGVDFPMQFIDVSGKLFGATEGTIGSDAAAPAPDTADLFDVTAGSNAVLSINGVTVERATNSFSVDGLSFNLTATTNEASTISVTQNTDKIYDTVIKFVEDYNKLVNTINGLLDAEATYRDYAPLTTAQEDEMTESQIEKWNEKAKEGLLRNDSTLTSVLASLRQTLYTKTEGGVALYDLGITTSYFGTKDNLTIEDKTSLKTKIAEDPEAIMKLFTDSEKGLSTLLNKAIDNAAKGSVSSPGSLVRMAGSKGLPDTSSSIYKQTKELKEKLTKLEDQYESEHERYWKQFSQMEQMIAQMNSTSSWLGNMFTT